jgi:hypothetical protein
MVFVIILYETLQIEIGLNLEKEAVFTSFRIKARNADLVAPPICAYL